jgi:hypothetical protein
MTASVYCLVDADPPRSPVNTYHNTPVAKSKQQAHAGEYSRCTLAERYAVHEGGGTLGFLEPSTLRAELWILSACSCKPM